MRTSIKTLIVATFVFYYLLFPVSPLIVNAQGNGKNKSTSSAAATANPTASTSYGFEVTNLDLPSNVSTNQQLDATITIKNTSNFKWEKTGGAAVYLSYHWIDANGEFETYRGDKTTLHKDLRPGESITQKLRVRSPAIAGQFKISIDVIKGNTWFTDVSNSQFKRDIKVTGSMSIASESLIAIEGGKVATNKSTVDIQLTSIPNQPGSTTAAYIYEYAQSTTSSINQIKNGTATWGSWRTINKPLSTSPTTNADLNIKGQFVGDVTVTTRLRAFKKHGDATPVSYGSAQYHYGSSAQTTGGYSDTIFFDNVPPNGGISINNGAYSTTSRYVELNIWADDLFNGVNGVGVADMRLTLNCDLNNPNAATWNSWQAVGNITNF
jgi:hypothetical protein